jgi:hypothetical protein
MQDPTPPPSVEWLDALLRLMGSKPDGLKHQCPAHGLTGQHSRSLVIRFEGETMLLYCHAGCTWREVFDALKMPYLFIRQAPPMEPARWHQIRLEAVRFPPPKAAAGGGTSGIGSAKRNEWFGYQLVGVHAYGDPEDIAWKWRFRHDGRPKRIIWKSRNERGLIQAGLHGRKEADLPLYRIRQVREQMEDGEVVVLCESESSADALWKEGVAATCGAGGAGSAPMGTITLALGRYPNVLIVPDHDEAGFAFGSRCGVLLPLARTKVPEAPKDDARDVLTRYGADWFTTAP